MSGDRGTARVVAVVALVLVALVASLPSATASPATRPEIAGVAFVGQCALLS